MLKHFTLREYLLACIYFLIALLILFLCWRQVNSLDVGFHLRAGKWIVENRSFPRLDTFSFTVNGIADYLDFNWLYQLILYAVYSAFNYPGIVLLNALLVLLSFFMVFVRCRVQSLKPNLGMSVILAISVLAISVIYGIRPHTFSWVLINLVLLCLEQYSKNNTVKSLYPIPVIMLLWVNIHSLFILGIVCIGCFYVASWIKNLKFDKNLSLVLGFSLVACLVNPYTYHSLIYPFRQFALLNKTNPFNQSISELSSSFKFDDYMFYGTFKLINPLSFYHLAGLLFIFLVIKNFRKIPLHTLFIISAFSYIGISAVKNIGYHLFAVLPYFILFASSFRLKWKEKDIKRKAETRSKKELKHPTFYVPPVAEVKQQAYALLAPVLLIALLVIALISIRTNRFYTVQRFPAFFGSSVDEISLPVHAAAFISEKKINGNILNHLNFGGYLMFATPNKVFIDGRLEVFGEQFYTSYLQLSGPQNETYFKQMTEKYAIQAVCFPYEISPSWSNYLKKSPDWRLVYFDEIAALYLKKDYRKDIPDADSSFVKNNTCGDTLRRDHDYYINLMYTNRFLKPQYFPYKERAISYFLYINGWNDSAIEMAECGQLRATGYYPELFFNLGSYFYKRKSFKEASMCYDRFLKTNDHPLARQRRGTAL